MPQLPRPHRKATFSLFIALLVVFFAPIPARADFASQFLDPVDGKFDVSTYLSENAFGFLPVPVVITEPAVDYGLGMMGLFFHEDEDSAATRKATMMDSDNAAAHLMPPSVSAVFAAYTGNESWILAGGHLGFFKQGKIRYMGGGGYGDINLDYYSIGDTELTRPLSLKTKAAVVMQSLKFQIAELPVFFGPSHKFIDAELSPAGNLGAVLPPSTPPELEDKITDLLTHDVTTSGLGLVVELDTRDNIFSPTTGYYYDFSYLAYRDAIGSDIDYDSYSLTGLNYFRLTPSLRAAIRLSGEIADSDERLPPFAQPALSLRGIPAARYQGTHVGVLEAEVTWEIDNRWSILGFAGAGRAADSNSSFDSASSRVSKGLGFRYQLARRYGFHMGIDVARGPEDTVFYIQAGSAW